MMLTDPLVLPSQQEPKPKRRIAQSILIWLALSALPIGLLSVLHPVIPSEPVVDDRPHSVTVAVAVPITQCSDFPLDAAAVLQYSILNVTSRFRYKFYAIYHPSAAACVQSLSSIGYTLLERETPVNVSEIEGEFYRGRLPKSGCCGEKELIKFEAFLLTDHPVVMLLDMDTLILKSLDDVLDLILFNRRLDNHHLMWPEQEIPNDIWLIYTTDYTMGFPKEPIKPTQGGFSVFKPNRTIYEDVREIVRKGDFDEDTGWGGKTGVFWGSTTYQGLLPYYFQSLNPGHSVELNWCRHNNMNSPPRELEREEDMNTCYTNQEDCEDCQTTRFEDIYSVHFTNCQKPWLCLLPEPLPRLCREMHHAWFQVRSEMEKSWGRTGQGSGRGNYESHFYGYCHDFGVKGYEQIRQPYGME